MPAHPVDLDNIKGRIAEALLESIFRRPGFRMARFGRECDLVVMNTNSLHATFAQLRKSATITAPLSPSENSPNVKIKAVRNNGGSGTTSGRRI